VIPIFLDRCPNLALVGIDGVFAPNEPNMLSRSQLGRNIPFAAENPTENPNTRINLDVLPYYSIIGQQGIGNLLWECGPPQTVMEDPQARKRYGDALYPIRWAQTPIAKSRGTENLVGWHVIRDIAEEVTTDIFGNFVPAKKTATVVQKRRLFVREGMNSRFVGTNRFSTILGDIGIEVGDSDAGIIARISPTEVVFAIPNGRVVVEAPRPLQATEGRFDGDRWMQDRECTVRPENKAVVFDLREPKVILLKY
jgi:hypothetical protein